jgi:hypothetical protein
MPGASASQSLHVWGGGPETDGVKQLHAKLRATVPLAEEIDGFYILLDDARSRECPHGHVFVGDVDLAWALHRAHIHGGRFQLLHGEDPRNFVARPVWAELEAALNLQLQDIAAHPQHPHFGMLNLARVLWSWRYRDVVTSKYAAGLWAMQELDPRWTPGIEAAIRDYEGETRPDDAGVLNAIFPNFLAFGTREIERLRAQ